jgi:hypothetical protein
VFGLVPSAKPRFNHHTRPALQSKQARARKRTTRLTQPTIHRRESKHLPDQCPASPAQISRLPPSTRSVLFFQQNPTARLFTFLQDENEEEEEEEDDNDENPIGSYSEWCYSNYRQVEVAAETAAQQAYDDVWKREDLKRDETRDVDSDFLYTYFYEIYRIAVQDKIEATKRRARRAANNTYEYVFKVHDRWIDQPLPLKNLTAYPEEPDIPDQPPDLHLVSPMHRHKN